MRSIRRSCRTRRARRPGPQSPGRTTRRNSPARERLRARRKAEVESPPLGGHRGGRSGEIVRRPPGVPRRLLHGRARRGLRPARAERRRQDHHAAHARRPSCPGRRHRGRRGTLDRGGPSRRAGAASARGAAHGVAGLLRPADRGGEPHVLRAPADGAPARPPVRRLARSIRPARARPSALRRAVARDEAEARHRPRAGARPRGHPSRRTHRRARSRGDPGGAQRGRRTGGGPRDDRPLHASSRGSRAPLFPGGVHRRTAGRNPRDPPREPAAHRARGAVRAGRRAGPLSFLAALREHALDRAASRGAGDRRRAGARGSPHRGSRSASRSARRCLAAAPGGGARAMIGVVIRKELLEVRRSPVLLLSMASLPATVVAVPIALLAWLAAALFCLGIDAIAGHMLLPDPAWLFGTLVLSPLLALFGNATAVVVSSRVLDPRAAQNLAASTVLPLLALLVFQLAGRIALGPRFYFALAAGVAAADVALIAVAVRLFDREKLLTR